MGFFSDLFGGGGTDFNEVALQQQAELAGGKKRARNELAAGKTEATGYFTPFHESGLAGQRLYDDSIGLGGQAGFARAKGIFDADPFAAGAQDASDNALLRMFRQYNARGMGDSGASRLATARSASEQYNARVADWRNRLSGRGDQGYSAATNLANIGYGHGSNLANLEQGHAQQMAQIWGNASNAEQQQKTQGVNNILGLAGNLLGAGAKIWGAR